MRAVCLTAPGRVEVVDVETPRPGPDEVLVRMRAVGLCGSDLTVYDGHRAVPRLPWVMGHEGGGDVAEVGSAVDPSNGLAVGTTVVLEPNVPCGRCASCLAGVTSLCPARRVLGMTSPGILSELVCLPASVVWPVPTDWTPPQLASLEPLAVAVAAVRRSAAVRGERALVVGAGSLGVQTCLALLGRGVTPEVADLDEARVAAAVSVGAAAAEATVGYDVVFETAGTGGALTAAVARTRPGGRVVLMGLAHEAVPMPVADLVRRGLTLTGSIIYDHPGDFAAAIELAGTPAVRRATALLGPGARPVQAAAAFEAARRRPTKSWLDLQDWSGG